MSAIAHGERRELLARVRAAARASDRSGRPTVAWFSRPVADLPPAALFAASAGYDRFFWAGPGDGVTLGAVGAAATLDGVGAERLQQVARKLETLSLAAGTETRVRREGPLLVGGFAFSSEDSGPTWSGFPAARFVLPQHLLVRRASGTVHVCAARVLPRADVGAIAAGVEAGWNALLADLERHTAGRSVRRATPPGADESPAIFRASADQPHARYCALVREALDAIHGGGVEKIVVARSCTLTRPGGFDATRVLETLRSSHPACFRFAVGSGDATLLAATPERLLRLEGRRVETSALAGSAPRGRTPEEDARLGVALRESKKEQAEHAVVVRGLRAGLAASCDSVTAPEAPALLRLEGIQHLYTPFTADLRPEAARSLLALASQLHPSPAVAGAPREAALAWLHAHEGLNRGWYGGAVGWMTADGDGELAVALRTVLLRGDRATLHAGAGIVAGSLPEAELAETRLKLRAGLAALLEI